MGGNPAQAFLGTVDVLGNDPAEPLLQRFVGGSVFAQLASPWIAIPAAPAPAIIECALRGLRLRLRIGSEPTTVPTEPGGSAFARRRKLP